MTETAPQTTWHVERCQLGTLACWRVRSAEAELLIAEQGAQILSYQRTDEPPIIWLSEQAAFQTGQSVRGGVPLCWPWFGDLARNPTPIQAAYLQPNQAPAHGLARTLPWQLDDLLTEAHQIRLNFSLSTKELPHWPHAVQPKLSISLGDRLSISLENHNLGDRPVCLSQALHTYFAVSDVRNIRIQGLEGCRYLETLEGWEERQQQAELSIEGETDRIYLNTPPLMRIQDPIWGRQICLKAEGSASAIVWNPWIDKAKRLSQFADDAWQRMLCIETANVLDDSLTLAPDGRSRLTLQLWTAPLD